MADDEHGVRIAREEGLEPDRAFEVEIVGRLVEQQHVGRARRAPPPAPPASASRRRTRRRRAPAPPRRSRGRSGSTPPAPRPNARRCRRAGRGSRRCGARRVAVSASAISARALGVGGEHGVDQAVARRRRLLRDAADPRAASAPRSRRRRARSSPRISRNSVVLPLPLRPTNPTLCPAGISAEASSKSFLPLDREADVPDRQHGADVARRPGAVNRSGAASRGTRSRPRPRPAGRRRSRRRRQAGCRRRCRSGRGRSSPPGWRTRSTR